MNPRDSEPGNFSRLLSTQIESASQAANRFPKPRIGFPPRGRWAIALGMKRALFSLATVLLISGCCTTMPKKAAVAVEFDSGDIARVEKSKTYHWSLPSSSEINPYNNQDLYLSLVKSDIDAQLAKKGYKLVATGGDLEVSFLMLYKDSASTTIVDQYFGTNRAPEHKLAHAMHKLPAANYEVGTLVVDVEDANDHESLWRGAVSAPVDHSKPFEAQKKRIDSAVALVMKDFPAAK